MKHVPKNAVREKIYTYIAEHINGAGLPPTIREIGTAVGISSISHI